MVFSLRRPNQTLNSSTTSSISTTTGNNSSSLRMGPHRHSKKKSQRHLSLSEGPQSHTYDQNFNSEKYLFFLRGTVFTCVMMAITLRVAFGLMPGMTRETCWTLTNFSYSIFSFFFFHWLCGSPTDNNQGEFDALTVWEQLDNGEQYTPARKFLTAFPVLLFLISTHYSRYDWNTFLVNLIFLMVQLLAKMPFMHRVRLFGINKRPSLD